MSYYSLLPKVKKELERAIFQDACGDGGNPDELRALLAVMILHTPDPNTCFCCDPVWCACGNRIPCPTIEAIEKEL